MSAGEETPNSDKRNILQPVVSPLTLDDYLPGAGIGEFTPGTPSTLPLVISEVEALESVANEADDLITSHLVKSYDGFASVLSEMNAIIEGNIANSLDKIEGVLGKVRNKILDNVANKLDHVYGIGMSLGFQPPTMEAVQYGLATGDYVGAMENPPIRQPESQPEMSPLEVPLVGGDGNTGLQPWYTNDSIDLVPAWNNGLCYCPVFTPLGIVYDWGSWNCITAPNTNGPIACNLLDWEVFAEDPREGRWYKWLILYGFSETANCGYKYVVTPAIGVNSMPMFIARNVDTGVLSAIGDGNTTLPAYTCAYRLQEIVVDLDGGGPNIDFPPPQPPQPPQPPTEPPTNPGVCAVNNFNCGTPVKPPDVPVLTKADTFCEQMAEWLKGVKWPDRMKFADFISMQWSSTAENSEFIKKLKSIFGTSLPVVPDMLNRFGQWLDNMYEAFNKSTQCNNSSLAGPQFVLSFLSLFNKYIPIVPLATMESQTQIVNSLCQYKIPMPSEANAMFLADVITYETWKCLHEANGTYVSEQKNIVKGMRTRLDPLNISKAYRKKLFGEETFNKMMRGAGVLEPIDRELIHEQTKSWPSISDVTRFLVRDVSDKEIVERFGMDDDFEKKWQGILIDFAEAIGVDKELGLYYWRAHWHIPSFTQLKEMAARLRPGRVDDDIAVTYTDMYEALKQDDWLPFWAKRMMAIGQPAVPKSEVVKAYNLHAIDEKELKERLLDLGYSNKDADFYTDYHKAWRKRDEKRKAGWPTLPALVKQYASCLITVDQFKQTLTELALSEEQIAEAVDAANLSYDVEIRRVTIQGIMYQYRKGLISEEQANASLSAAGVPPGCVPTLVKRWTSQKLRQPKHAQAASLCKMRRYGIITAGEQTAALIRGGWDTLDAERITAVCTYDMTEEQARKALQDAQRAKREYERQLKEDAKRRKLEQCGPPPCPANTPGGKEKPPIVPT